MLISHHSRWQVDLLIYEVLYKKAYKNLVSLQIVTTYEMIIKDQQYLSRYDWKVSVSDCKISGT
jgi:hypothetical protein